jgi:hydrogenase nickel incorporation protein HypB
MCTTCGCNTGDLRINGAQPALQLKPRQAQQSATGTGAFRPAQNPMPSLFAHAASTPQKRRIQLETDILADNNHEAQRNRQRLARAGLFTLNWVSSPGSGKTRLLVATIEALRDRWPLAVIEGDQQTDQDAQRIRATGVPAVQINTGKGCHLDAHAVGLALDELYGPQGPAHKGTGGLLCIENVGNLVCPAAFDLGEEAKVVILSVTEGEDKPLKYPDMFAASSLMLINKCDLLPYVDFDLHRAMAYAREVNPALTILPVSAKTGEGFAAWLAWLEDGLTQARSGAPSTTIASV